MPGCAIQVHLTTALYGELGLHIHNITIAR